MMFLALAFDVKRLPPLSDRVAEAAARYRAKFGVEPETVIVSDRDVGPECVDALAIERRSFVALGLLYIGVREQSGEPS